MGTSPQRVVLSFLSLSFILAEPLRANWMFDGKSGVLYDSNVSRSNRSSDVLDDQAWKTSLAAGYGWQLIDNLRVSLSGELESHIWGNYSALDVVSPSIDANLRYRFGLGANAPWIRSETRSSYSEFRENRRSGWSFHQGLRIGKNITERLSLDGSYLFENFSAQDFIFNQTAHSGSANVNFSVTSSFQVSGGYTFRYGDVISHGVPPRPDIASIASAFGPVTTFGTPYVAYRFEASTHVLAMAASQSLNNFAAVQLAYEWQYTSRDQLSYINHVIEARVAVSF
jgi:hypothetical protein